MNSMNPALDWIDFIAYDGLSATEAAEKMKNIEACCILITYIFLYFSTIQKKPILQKGSHPVTLHCGNAIS